MRLPLPTLLALLAAMAPALHSQQRGKTRNLILVTTDGLRWQEVFRGIAPALANRSDAGMRAAPEVSERFGGATRNESRRLLLPFFWGVMAEQGVILGNRDEGGRVEVRNRNRFSYPGYAEILTGRPHDGVIDSNAMRPNPSRTVLEILRQEWGLAPSKIALFASWEVFRGIGAHDPRAVFINAGYQRLGAAAVTPRLEDLSQRQFEVMTGWRSARHDAITCELAVEYLRAERPRAIYVALDETDDWAHAGRYDRTLEMANYFDSCLAKLWTTVEHDPFYRDQTTMIVSTDHGRGPGPADWKGHGIKVEASNAIWIAAIGPDTAAQGDIEPDQTFSQSDIAPTLLELVGVDPALLDNAVGRPIRQISGR